MWIKLAAAACALILAIISIGFETVDRSHRGGLLKRIRAPGYLGILAAIGVFAFGGLNEHLSSQEQKHLRERIESLSEALQQADDKLSTVRNSLETAITEALRSRQAISLLEEASRGQLVRVAYREQDFASLAGIDTELMDGSGEVMRPRKGDEINWRISCFGRIPEPSELVNVDWCGPGYGDMIANSYKFSVGGVEGRKTFIGTRSTGGPLVYERPYNSCAPLYDALVQSRCSMEIQIYRELRAIQLDILDQKGYRSVATGDPRDSKLCQMYERLYEGESCDDLME